ncbi:MAG: chorismate lyase [Pseudomonadota bacterium]
MTGAALATVQRHAYWHTHINGVNAPDAMRHWLTDNTSLTAKLVARSQQFRVQRLHQRLDKCLSDEAKQIGLVRPLIVWEREVLLRCDERPMIFAHTVVPRSASAADWPQFGALGERSLGSTLFGDPLVQRGRLQFARLHSGHPLAQRALACSHESGAPPSATLYARRCLYRRKAGLLLVAEVFLPAIVDLPGAAIGSGKSGNASVVATAYVR